MTLRSVTRSIDALRRLAAQAEAHGADPRQIQADVDAVFFALSAVDKRKFDAMQLAQEVRAAERVYRANGIDGRIGKLARRFKKSRQWIYQILDDKWPLDNIPVRSSSP